MTTDLMQETMAALERHRGCLLELHKAIRAEVPNVSYRWLHSVANGSYKSDAGHIKLTLVRDLARRIRPKRKPYTRKTG